MVEVLEFVPVILLICGPPLLAGLFGAQVVGWVWASGLVGMAILTTVNEPESYDMPGFGLWLFGAAAALAVLALFAGIVLRRVRESRRARES